MVDKAVEMLDPAKVKATPLFVTLVFILSVFMPGFTGIYLFDSELFIKLDLAKLAILALIVSCPLFFLNYLILIGIKRLPGIHDNPETQEQAASNIYMYGLATSLITVVILYVIIFTTYILSQQYIVSLSNVIIGVVCGYILLASTVVYQRVYSNSKKLGGVQA